MIRAVFAVALLVRIGLIAQRGWGYQADLAFFTGWMRGLSELGLAGFYASGAFCDYPPLLVLLFAALGWIVDVVTGGLADHDLQLAVKAATTVADAAIAALLWRRVGTLMGPAMAATAAGMYLLNPVTLYDSAYWGQVDAVHTLLLLAALVAAESGRWGLSGAGSGLALLAKFQSIAVIPLIVVEAARHGGGAAGRLAGGALVAAVAVLVPFAITGTADDVLTRAYVDVVGQYESLTLNAFNLWWLTGTPDAPDFVPPPALVELAAGARHVVAHDGSWLLTLTWRRISLVLYAGVVAGLLGLYVRRPGRLALYRTGGLLALAFFLFPTEMHERYAFPAMALLVPWAMARRHHERIYWAITMSLLLNLVVVLKPDPLAPFVAVALLALFGFALLPSRPDDNVRVAADAHVEPPRVVAGALRMLLPASAVVVIGLGVGALLVSGLARAGDGSPGADARWLSSMTPLEARQGWGELRADRAVSGAPLSIGTSYYTRGLGTHAPARIRYAVPEGMTHFVAVIGVDASTDGNGSARVRVLVDGVDRAGTDVLRSGDAGVELRVTVRGARELVIEADPTDDGLRHDHVSLGLARFERTSDPAAGPGSESEGISRAP